MLINKSLNPRAFKNIDMAKLPIFWTANQKGWMTKVLFKRWFNECFIPDVEKYLYDKNLSFKILLLIDNASSHSKDINHPNVKIVFFPPNCTSLIQPLDQGIIATIKSYYIRRTFKKIFDRLEEDKELSVIQAFKDFTILDCIEAIDLSFKELKKETINACWRPLLPQMVNQSNIIPHERLVEHQKIIEIASKIDGLKEININDIEELLAADTLDDEELIELLDTNSNDQYENENESQLIVNHNFNKNKLEKALELAENLKDFIMENDPSIVRSDKFIRELNYCMQPYQIIFDSLK